MTVIVTIVTAIHMLPTCVGHPQNLPLPLPHSPLFAFIVVVQIIGQWSAATALKITERRVVYPAQHPAGTPETNNENLLASSEISQKSNGKSRNNDKPRTSGKNPQRPVTGRQHHQQPQRPTQGKPNNNSFPYRDYRFHDQPRQTRFNEKQNQMYSPYHFAPSPALSAGSDLLSRSIMQLAETQSRLLEIFAAQQKSQIDVYQELTRSNKEKEHDALFMSIPVFDGDHNQCEQWLDDMDQATRISGRDLRTELIKKSTGVVRNVIMMAHPRASDDDLIHMIREDFSDAPTMNEAWGSCSTCARNLKSKCVFTFTGMVTCTRGHQASGQLMKHTNT